MEDIVEKLQKIVDELRQYQTDIYTCEMCNNVNTSPDEYPCVECKRSYSDYFTLRMED